MAPKYKKKSSNYNFLRAKEGGLIKQLVSLASISKRYFIWYRIAWKKFCLEEARTNKHLAYLLENDINGVIE